MKLKLVLAAVAPAILAACSQSPESTATEGTQAEAVEVVVPSGEYTLDKTHASLMWSIPHMGIADYVVRMADIDANLTLNTDDVSQSSVVVTIDPLSVSTLFPGDYQPRGGATYTSFDEEISKSPDFLNAADGAAITFTSTSVEQTGATTARITGDLQMRGQTHPVTLDATLSGQMENHPFGGMPVVGFSATGSFKPSDFGVNLMNGALGDEVKVTFNGEFHGAAAETAPAPAQ